MGNPPWEDDKVIVSGASWRVGGCGAAIVKVTGIGVAGAVWLEEMLIWPAYVPGPRLPGLAETLRLAGVWFADAATVSQLPPVVIDADASSALGTLLKTETVCEGGCGTAEVL